MASDAYMEVETRELIGETFDERFGMEDPGSRGQGAFEISSFSLSATSNRDDDDDNQAPKPTGPSPGRTASGIAAAKQAQTTIKQFTIKKPIDQASPELFLACCKQSKIEWAVISLREAGDPEPKAPNTEAGRARKPWLILEFTDLYVDSFGWELDPGESGDEAKGQEMISFSFGTIRFKYNPQEMTGEHTGKRMSNKGWNRHKNNLDAPDLGSENW